MSNTTAYRWHVGANVPGYSPESEPGCFATADEARDALCDELRHTRDTLIEGLCAHENITDGCEGCALFTAVNEQTMTIRVRAVDVAEGYTVSVDIGRALPIMHWVVRIDASEFDNHADCNPDD